MLDVIPVFLATPPLSSSLSPEKIPCQTSRTRWSDCFILVHGTLLFTTCHSLVPRFAIVIVSALRFSPFSFLLSLYTLFLLSKCPETSYSLLQYSR